MTDRKRLLDNASEYVLKQRNKSYGEPDEDFQRIARIASAMGFRMAPEGSNGPHRELKGSDVALFMIALKTSRLVWSPDHEDSWTDVAGYAACGFETANLQRSRETQDVLYPDEEPEETSKPVHGSRREGPRRLGVDKFTWDILVDLANRVLNGEPPSVLEDRRFMLIHSDDAEPKGSCSSAYCRTSRGDELHSFVEGCAWRIRPRRYLG